MRAALPSWDEYAGAWSALHGGVDPRQARASVRNWLYFGYAIAKICARLHVRPGVVTAIGLIACVATPVLAVRGSVWALLAAALVLVTAIADTVDGALAVLTAHTTRLGYVYDAIVDRIGEGCWLLSLWLIGVPGYAVVAAGTLSWLHEYARSRANAAGMAEIGSATLGERPTRVILAVLGIGMSGLVGATSDALPAGIATFAVAVWIVLSIIGFAQLFATVHNVLAGHVWSPRPRRRSGTGAAGSTTGGGSGTGEFTIPGLGRVGRPADLGLDPRHVRESRARSGPAPKPDPAASAAPASAPRETPGSPGVAPPERPVIDEELLREISELDDLPGASVVYTSTSVGEKHLASSEAAPADDGQAEGERQES